MWEGTDGGCGRGQEWRVWEGPGMEGVGGARDGGCGSGQGWRVLEGSGMEGVGGTRDEGGARDGGCGRVKQLFSWGFHNLYINP